MSALADCPAFVTEAIEQAADRVALTQALLANDGDALLHEVRAAIEKHEADMLRGREVSAELQRLRETYGPGVRA